VKLGMSVNETCAVLTEACGSEVVKKPVLTEWHKLFRKCLDVYLQRDTPSAEKHCSTTMLNSILTHNLHNEFKGFCKRIHYIEAMLHQLKYTKS